MDAEIGGRGSTGGGQRGIGHSSCDYRRRFHQFVFLGLRRGVVETERHEEEEQGEGFPDHTDPHQVQPHVLVVIEITRASLLALLLPEQTRRVNQFPEQDGTRNGT